MQWPTDLPQRLNVSDYSETFGQGAIRQDMDAGPAYQRPRYTATVEPISGSMILTKTQYARLKEFWVDTKSGALSFDWVHPITDEPATVQFDASQPPTISAQSGAFFKASINIEILS